jgi:hypothetical protein
MFKSQNTALLMVNALVTVVFTLVAVWLFINISSKNAGKKWFKMIFSGKEWTPVIKSIELLNQISEFTSDGKISDTTTATQSGI